MRHLGPGDFEFDFRQQASGPGAPGDPLTEHGGGGDVRPSPQIDPPDDDPGLCPTRPTERPPTEAEGGGAAPTTWTPDWCAQAIVGEVVLVGDLNEDGTNRSPLSGTFERGTFDGSLPFGLEVGFAYPMTIHLVRAKEHLLITEMKMVGADAGDPDDGPPHLEAGMLSLGRYCVRPDGFEHVVHCSERIEDLVSGVGFGEPFLHRDGLLNADPDAARITRDASGFDLDLIAYETPFVQESSLRSFRPNCGVPF